MAIPNTSRQQVRELIERGFADMSPRARLQNAISLAERIVEAAVPGVPEFKELHAAYRDFVFDDGSEARLDRVMSSVSVVPFGDPLKGPMLKLGRCLESLRAGTGNARSLLEALTEIAYVALSQDDFYGAGRRVLDII